MTGDILPSYGTAIMNSHDLLQNAADVRRDVGYCPQFDAQLPTLTAREHLTLFGRIKVSFREIGVQNVSFIDIFCLFNLKSQSFFLKGA